MGYTSYWEQKNKIVLTPAQTNLIKGVLVEYKDILANGMGKVGSKPKFTAKGISLNGLDNENDDAHETFAVEFDKPKEFAFCKTARKPYDAAVCKILAILSLSDGFYFSSDGLGKDGEEDENWKESLDWAEGVTQAPVRDRLRTYLLNH